MVRHELAIEQWKSADFQPGHEPRQCYFRSIPGPGKHTLTTKCAANRQAVKTADQLILSGRFIPHPAFDAMRMAQLVQLVERLFYFGIDPGVPAVPCLCGTNRNNIGKGLVGGHPKTVGSYGFAERARHPEIVERDNRTGLGFDPERFRIIAGVGHRKYARAIGFHQQVKINSHE